MIFVKLILHSKQTHTHAFLDASFFVHQTSHVICLGQSEHHAVMSDNSIITWTLWQIQSTFNTRDVFVCGFSLSFSLPNKTHYRAGSTADVDISLCFAKSDEHWLWISTYAIFSKYVFLVWKKAKHSHKRRRWENTHAIKKCVCFANGKTMRTRKVHHLCVCE